jgi:hypothetical protein
MKEIMNGIKVYGVSQHQEIIKTLSTNDEVELITENDGDYFKIKALVNNQEIGVVHDDMKYEVKDNMGPNVYPKISWVGEKYDNYGIRLSLMQETEVSPVEIEVIKNIYINYPLTFLEDDFTSQSYYEPFKVIFKYEHNGNYLYQVIINNYYAVISLPVKVSEDKLLVTINTLKKDVDDFKLTVDISEVETIKVGKALAQQIKERADYD